MKLLLDEHYANDIATALRAAGHDAVTVSERGLKGLGDEPLLALAASEDRALLTNNARDFLPLVRRWAQSGEDHCGLVLTSDSTMPRAKASVDLYVERLRDLMEVNPARRALANQIRWLP